MTQETKKVTVLIQKLLSQLSECSGLCDKIVVLSLGNSESPLPPNLGELASQTERFNAAHEWLAQAQEFQADHTSGLQLSEKIVKHQKVIRLLAIQLQSELRNILEESARL